MKVAVAFIIKMKAWLEKLHLRSQIKLHFLLNHINLNLKSKVK